MPAGQRPRRVLRRAQQQNAALPVGQQDGGGDPGDEVGPLSAVPRPADALAVVVVVHPARGLAVQLAREGHAGPDRPLAQLVLSHRHSVRRTGQRPGAAGERYRSVPRVIAPCPRHPAWRGRCETRKLAGGAASVSVTTARREPPPHNVRFARTGRACGRTRTARVLRTASARRQALPCLALPACGSRVAPAAAQQTTFAIQRAAPHPRRRDCTAPKSPSTDSAPTNPPQHSITTHDTRHVEAGNRQPTGSTFRGVRRPHYSPAHVDIAFQSAAVSALAVGREQQALGVDKARAERGGHVHGGQLARVHRRVVGHRGERLTAAERPGDRQDLVPAAVHL